MDGLYFMDDFGPLAPAPVTPEMTMSEIDSLKGLQTDW